MRRNLKAGKMRNSGPRLNVSTDECHGPIFGNRFPRKHKG